MIKLIANIKLTDSNSGTLNAATFTNKNNISGDYSTILSKKNSIGNPFILSSNGYGSKLGSGDYFSSQEKYFIGSVSSDSNGNFSDGSYVIVISGDSIKTLNIEFDSKNNLHPNQIVVNNVTYSDDDPIFTIGFSTPVSTVTIEIKDWNKPNYPLIISGIYIDVEINLDERSITGFEYNIYDREYNDKPSYGIVSSSGTISYNDTDRQTIDYIRSNFIDKYCSVSVYISNNLYSTKHIIAKTYTRDWEYDNNNFEVTVSLQDDLDKMQQYEFLGLKYSGDGMTGKQIYNYLYDSTPDEFIFPEFDDLDEETKSFLTSSKINFPYMEKSSVWSAWDKFAKAFCCKIYKNNNDKIIVAHKVI